MSTETRDCLACRASFNAKTSELKRGNAKFCSRACGHKSAEHQYVHTTNHTCSQCQIPFYRRKSSDKNSKSGHYFCSRSCKDTAQKIGGIVDIQPSHYKTGVSSYHKKAIEQLGIECQRCGYHKYPICVVHHKDRNRQNNSIENLEVLCSRCHDEDHFLNSDGRFANVAGE